jgi:hypothetical protein
MLMVIIVLAVPTAIACWLSERVDRPIRRKLREAQMVQPAE